MIEEMNCNSERGENFLGASDESEEGEHDEVG